MSTFMACDYCGEKIVGPYWSLNPWVWGQSFQAAWGEYRDLTFDLTACLARWIEDHDGLSFNDVFEDPAES